MSEALKDYIYDQTLNNFPLSSRQLFEWASDQDTADLDYEVFNQMIEELMADGLINLFMIGEHGNHQYILFPANHTEPPPFIWFSKVKPASADWSKIDE